MLGMSTYQKKKKSMSWMLTLQVSKHAYLILLLFFFKKRKQDNCLPSYLKS